MKINKLVVGYLKENCYVLVKDNNCLVIDPGDEYDKINEYISDKRIIGILITHNHFDHVGALAELVKNYNVKVYDRNNLEEKEYIVSEFKFEVIYTPGHKEDSLTYYFMEDNVMFTGDFIFNDGIGRCDLPGGNYQVMLDSLHKMKKYDRDIIIYPGHGDMSTLGMELDKYL